MVCEISTSRVRFWSQICVAVRMSESFGVFMISRVCEEDMNLVKVSETLTCVSGQ